MAQYFLSVKRRSTGYAKTWIVFPSVIWGLADTIFVKEGLQKPESQLVPSRIKLGRAVYVGEGKNVLSHVHVDEGTEVFHPVQFGAKLTYSKYTSSWQFLPHPLRRDRFWKTASLRP